jgi:hypothetical protein
MLINKINFENHEICYKLVFNFLILIMKTSALKKEIIKTIETMEDINLLEAVHTLLSRQVKPHHYQLTEEDISIIEESEAEYKSGTAKTYTVDQVKKKILKKYNK